MKLEVVIAIGVLIGAAALQVGIWRFLEGRMNPKPRKKFRKYKGLPLPGEKS